MHANKKCYASSFCPHEELECLCYYICENDNNSSWSLYLSSVWIILTKRFPKPNNGFAISTYIFLRNESIQKAFLVLPLIYLIVLSSRHKIIQIILIVCLEFPVPLENVFTHSENFVGQGLQMLTYVRHKKPFTTKGL